MRGLLSGALVTAAVLVAAASAHAAPAPIDYQGNGDSGGFRNVLPAGQGSNATTLEIAQNQANGFQPPHEHDQYDMYADLVYEAPITEAEIANHFKDASFGTRPEQRERTYSPRADVTIVRDDFGVPHIYGEGRDGAMFGAGYASAEDRLFFMDILRHAGRAELSSFIGGGQTGMDHDVWADTPYTEDELQLQYDLGDELYGAEGAQLQRDVDNYVAGINRYISEARVDPSKMPGEYALTARPGGPDDWKVTDVIATASLVAGIFGKGGGGEVGSAVVLDEATQRFGKKGKRVWSDFRSAEDPEAPTTVHKKKFPYEKVPKKTPGRALPDRGTLEREPLIVAASGAGGPAETRSLSPLAETPGPDAAASVVGPLGQFTGASNALLVSARESESGEPLAVYGPQVSYFAPQILMEQSIHAPGGPQGPPLDARGAAFLGTNLYVQLGRGRDYSWSATSAGQDIIDTFALPLCEPGGGEPTLDSQAYLYRGQCTPFEVLERENSWQPNPAVDPTPAGSETLRALRTKLGIVTHRAEIDGEPYVYTRLRATYFHEVDSALGFADYNNPEKMRTPEDFMRAACRIDYTFNWFYINQDEIAYFNSGYNPKRSKKVDPNFPAFGDKKKYEWKGYIPPSDEVFKPTPANSAAVDPRSLTADQEPCRKRPQVIDQRYLTSWNNKQARGYRASDAEWGYQSIYRSDPLDERIEDEIAGGGKMSIVELINAMEDAGTVDLRGDAVLPWLLKVIGKGRGANAQTKDAIKTLRAWSKAGAHRRDLNRDGVYDHAEAVRIMDAWWPLLLEAQFKPTLGDELYDAIVAQRSIDDTPHKDGTNQGSAYNGGWYGYVHKDLRAILGKKVKGRYSRVYCGKGDLDRCREALIDSLETAAATPASEVYADADDCDVGDAQMCYDAVEFAATGGISQPPFHWINRPTFQQVVEPGGAP
jgi:acyl-homoserine lactone acylase PvdQ